MTETIVEGTSEPLYFRLRDDGAPIDGTGFEVGLAIGRNVVGEDPAPLTLEDLEEGQELPTVEWLAQAEGTVRVTGAEVLSAGKYLVRFTLTDESEKVGYCPNQQKPSDIWDVVPVLNR